MLRKRIESEIVETVNKLWGDEVFQANLKSFKVEIPDERFGEFSTNIAMILSKPLKTKPIEIAKKIVEKIKTGELFENVEIAGPGFINFKLKKNVYTELLKNILNTGERYGRKEPNGMKVQIEFVSANPTGPLTVGHGRQAVIGDVLSKVFKEEGFEVTKEYYFNDAGRQMDLLAQSLWVRYNQFFGKKLDIPEDGYHGDYLVELAKEIAGKFKADYVGKWNDEIKEIFKEMAKDAMFKLIKSTLERLKVQFDIFFNEKSLLEDGTVNEVIEILKSKGLLYEKDGALWFKVSEFVDEDDKVLIRSSGIPTYFMTDIAYHYNKFKRKFDRVYDIWGADHHGHISRMKAAMKALGIPDDFFNVILHQFVTLKKEGKEVKMSTRKGEFVTLDELMDSVGVDATRYFFAMIDPNTHMIFDMDLAVSKSNENPVYYVQYAYARIKSLFRKAREKGIEYRKGENLDLLCDIDQEKLLVRDLDLFDETLEDTLRDLAPNKITNYVEKLVSRFHNYYTDNIILDTDNRDLSNARLNLCKGLETILSKVFDILGISKPEKM
ncbi:MAG: arginyl-tRNA synthetase [Thermotogaceae bacterium]|jgi:arginyl-tRNA synthetase|nr:arginyl-tRNA synthetase [Thermotogaceae bacterium]MDN5337646.1 arginyl-tRNA synthetase [Thermotogaceae bacterium]